MQRDELDKKIKTFYDTTSNDRDKPIDESRYTHNFLKACIIEDYVEKNCKLLDLGCGKGGDFPKLMRKKLERYDGIDFSSTSLNIAKQRACDLKFVCNLKLSDINRLEWKCAKIYDVIMSQFAIHYACSSEKNAECVMHAIYDSLKEGGVFIGTIPHHDAPSYSQVIFYTTDISKKCTEYTVSIEDLQKICHRVGFKILLSCEFSEYYEQMKVKYNQLSQRMSAKSPPKKNWIFVFQR